MYRCVLVVYVGRGSSVQMCVSCVCRKKQQCTDVCVGTSFDKVMGFSETARFYKALSQLCTDVC